MMNCTAWLQDHPKASFEEWKEVAGKRLAALQEQTVIFKQQLANIKRENGKNH